MNKKKIIIVFVIATVLIFSLIFITRSSNSNKNTGATNDMSDAETIDEITIDDGNHRFKAIYNADSFVYEIFDENNNLLMVAPNKEMVDEYIRNPQLLYSVNDLPENDYNK